MKIKEVCERTGLTDRAIRLYMDQGLVKPNEEWSYTGRRAITFSEEDVRALENVATLRRADFSIADIVKMKEEPGAIPEIVAQHKKTIANDIENKINILSILDDCDCGNFNDYGDIAEVIRASASRNIIPKEDSGMNLRDVKRMIKGRTPPLIALIFLVIGVIGIVPVAFKAVFARAQVLSGGGFELIYDFSLLKVGQNAMLLTAVSVIIFAAVALTVYMAGGKKWWLIAGGALCVMSIVLLLFLPTEEGQRLFFYEFLNYRSVFKNTMFYSANNPDFLIKGIKFIPLAISAVLCCVGFFTEKDINNNIQ